LPEGGSHDFLTATDGLVMIPRLDGHYGAVQTVAEAISFFAHEAELEGEATGLALHADGAVHGITALDEGNASALAHGEGTVEIMRAVHVAEAAGGELHAAHDREVETPAAANNAHLHGRLHMAHFALALARAGDHRFAAHVLAGNTPARL